MNIEHKALYEKTMRYQKLLVQCGYVNNKWFANIKTS